jgi:hypothetical protein
LKTEYLTIFLLPIGRCGIVVFGLSIQPQAQSQSRRDFLGKSGEMKNIFKMESHYVRRFLRKDFLHTHTHTHIFCETPHLGHEFSPERFLRANILNPPGRLIILPIDGESKNNYNRFQLDSLEMW